jgi:hypothetical protein
VLSLTLTFRPFPLPLVTKPSRMPKPMLPAIRPFAVATCAVVRRCHLQVPLKRRAHNVQGVPSDAERVSNVVDELVNNTMRFEELRILVEDIPISNLFSSGHFKPRLPAFIAYRLFTGVPDNMASCAHRNMQSILAVRRVSCVS